ncbi:DUF5677 domain-containing protein [Priestia aryabhattai]|uniref:DUF5677 domain-containing protein n=1 Tax=Priestia aryabhattai TaxID=412384 RepID=A0AAX6NDP7_PRIAR|nr:DUF5677 domain-containing protein [Priestia aryabhattai]MDU9693624.1 DUF5677 domain-containing protein [Priestia aryabhattai]
MEIINHEEKLDKYINKFIRRSRDFVEYAAHPYGMADLLHRGERNSKFTYDHEYFNFTKSTKTLISIKNLLGIGHNEDAIILIRSMFENYLSSRYLNENEEYIDQLVTHPLNLFAATYNVRENGEIYDRDNNKVGDLINPSAFKIGKDKAYYHLFYGFLSPFSHSNFGIADCYLNEHLMFTISKINYPLLTRFFALFVFTKIFEHIVTVEGEEFINPRTEKECYKLVEESIKYQNELIPVLIEEYKPTENKNLKHYNKRMREMLKEMKKSLKEELGSVNKDFLN